MTMSTTNRSAGEHHHPEISSIWRVVARGMVIAKSGGTIFFTLFATVVVLVSEKTSLDLGISNQLLTILGLALGFVITFRTSSAYEKFQDERKMWTNIIVASRNLAQQIWVHVPVDEPRKNIDNPSLEIPTPEEVQEEKDRMIKLIQALSVSVKHRLRGEDGVYYQGLWPLVHFLPQRVPDQKEGPRDGIIPPYDFFSSEKRKRPPIVTMFDYVKFHLLVAWLVISGSSIPLESMTNTVKRKTYGGDTAQVHMPIELCLVLSRYVNFLIRNKVVDPVISSRIADNLFLLQDTVANLERLSDTPLPFAYQAHLNTSVWLYLLVLPFQIYPTYRYVAIPATTFVAFLMLGFLSIAEEVEHCFDYDLDHICSIIERDIREIITHTNIEDRNSLVFGGSWRQK